MSGSRFLPSMLKRTKLLQCAHFQIRRNFFLLNLSQSTYATYCSTLSCTLPKQICIKLIIEKYHVLFYLYSYIILYMILGKLKYKEILLAKKFQTAHIFARHLF